jgi:hypothetical protein
MKYEAHKKPKDGHGTDRNKYPTVYSIQLLSYVEINSVSNETFGRKVSTHNGMQPIKYIKLHIGLIKWTK